MIRPLWGRFLPTISLSAGSILHLFYSLHAARYAERGGDGRRTAGFACLEENIFSLKEK